MTVWYWAATHDLPYLCSQSQCSILRLLQPIKWRQAVEGLCWCLCAGSKVTCLLQSAIDQCIIDLTGSKVRRSARPLACLELRRRCVASRWTVVARCCMRSDAVSTCYRVAADRLLLCS